MIRKAAKRPKAPPPPAQKAPRASGRSLTYAERKAAGRPTVTLCLTLETVELLADVAARLTLSKSACVELAVRELAKHRK